MSGDGRHTRAVAQSFRHAQEAAGTGDYDEALGWLRAVEAVDGFLPREWAAKRAVWAHQSQAATTNGRP